MADEIEEEGGSQPAPRKGLPIKGGQEDDPVWTGPEPSAGGTEPASAEDEASEPWTGEELASIKASAEDHAEQDQAAWTGDERTLADTDLPMVYDEDAAPKPAWTGDERTLADTPVPMDAGDGTWTGDERTLADTPLPPPQDDAPWAGDERTLADTPLPPSQPGGGTVGTWVGSENTMETPVTMPSQGPWAGDEGTLVDRPAPPDTDGASGQPWVGAERTVAGGEGYAEARAAKARAVREAREAKESAQKSDGLWHTDGREGPCTGMVWGDYEVGAILGEGGMGVVYKGRQVSLNRRVAIKVLPAAMANDATLRERFEMESRTASLLQSPHVVQVFTAGNQQNNLYFVMEYVEGRELSDIIRDTYGKGGRLTPFDAGEYIVQAGRGLMEAQRHGFVHRDIKPANLMVTNDGLVKIADFGIVKVVGEHTLTMTGTAVGTPSYVSPEQGKGESTDARADIYSLGVVFYELLTGERPFKAATPNALIYQHCYSEPKLPSELQDDIPKEYEAVVIKCLQKNPDDRYPDAGALVQDLERIQIGHSPMVAVFAGKIGTGADAAARANMNWLQRNLLPVSVAALLLIGGGVGGGWWWMQAQQAAENQRIAQERVALQLRPSLASALDVVAPLPEDVDQRLDDLEKVALDGAEDEDLVRWRAKVAQVRELASQLSVLDGDAVDGATRDAAVTALDRYASLVGSNDAAATRWAGRLETLNQREQTLRNSLSDLFSGALNQSSRTAAGMALDELAALSTADDPQLMQGRERVRVFDDQVSGLIAELEVLDKAGQVAEHKRQELLVSLGQLKPLLGEGDARVQRWGARLQAAGNLLSRLRSQLSPVFATTRPSIPALEAVGSDLDLLSQLVGSEDADVSRWRTQAENSRERVKELRHKLSELEKKLPSDGIATTSQLAAAEPAIKELDGMVAAGDEQIARWRQLVRNSEAQIKAWTSRLADRLDPSALAPVGIGEQSVLSALRQRLVDKVAVDPERADLWAARLKREALRVAELQDRLHENLDEPAAFSSELAEDLAQYLRDVGSDNEDGQRWAAKAQRIRTLRESLQVLDQRRSVPEDYAVLFKRLVGEVGEDAPEVQRWQEKVRALEDIFAGLKSLDEAASLPADVDTKLGSLAQLVGDDDPTLRRYIDKVDRVRGLAMKLEHLDRQLSLSPQQLDQAHEELVALVGLVGTNDATTVAAAARIVELEGPPQPSWAVESGRDQFGLWAAFEVGGERYRMRFIASGSFVMGSSETGADADETAVPVTLSKAYWLAENECTQALWEVVMGNNPSRFVDPMRPVERVDYASCQAFVSLLGELVDGLQPRLPSEAEWEMAARAGMSGPWYLPEGEENVGAIAWYRENSKRSSQVVAGRYPNPLGLYDMHGNVSEWVADSYAPYPTSAAVDPIGRGGGKRVARGGSWGDAAGLLRASNRIPIASDMTSLFLGLRIAAPVDWVGGKPDGSLLLAADGDQRQLQMAWGPFEIRVRLPSLPEQHPTDSAVSTDGGEPQ